MARREVVWSYEATNDLEALADFIAKDSAFYAGAFVAEIRDAGRTLSEFSARGRVVPELNRSDIRELFIKDYRMIYLIEESRVIILAFIHGSMRLRIFSK